MAHTKRRKEEKRRARRGEWMDQCPLYIHIYIEIQKHRSLERERGDQKDFGERETEPYVVRESSSAPH